MIAPTAVLRKGRIFAPLAVSGGPPTTFGGTGRPGPSRDR